MKLETDLIRCFVVNSNRDPSIFFSGDVNTVDASIDVHQVGEEALFFQRENGIFAFWESDLELTILIGDHFGDERALNLLEEDAIAGNIIECDCLVDVDFADGPLLRSQGFSFGGGHLVSTYPEDLALNTLFLA